jgi:hypothetical protein
MTTKNLVDAFFSYNNALLPAMFQFSRSVPPSLSSSLSFSRRNQSFVQVPGTQAYDTHLRPWQLLLLDDDMTAAHYPTMHPIIVKKLVEHYHKAADHSGDKERPYVAADFDYASEDPKAMHAILQSIQRSAGDSYTVQASEETRAKIVTELGRCKWQDAKAPPVLPWSPCRAPALCTTTFWRIHS